MCPTSDSDKYLTPSQRAERRAEKEREAAKELAAEHGLPMHLALDVASKKCKLEEALQGLSEEIDRAKSDAREARRMSGPQKAIGVIAVVLVLLVCSSFVRSTWRSHVAEINDPHPTIVTAPKPTQVPEPDRPTTKPPEPGTEVTRGDEGQILKVVGPGPSAVAVAFCEASIPPCEPIEIAMTVPPQTGARLAIYKSFTEMTKNYALLVRRDNDSGKWAASGSGFPVDNRRVGEPRLPITR